MRRAAFRRARHPGPGPSYGSAHAFVHYERFTCVKAFGKEVVKRLVGGNASVEVTLTPSVQTGQFLLVAHVEKIDADGSLGAFLDSPSFGDRIREKIASSIQSAIQKSADAAAVLSPEIKRAAAVQSARFADGGASRLQFVASGPVRLTAEQIRNLASPSKP